MIAIHKSNSEIVGALVKYCDKNNIEYVFVNAYDNDIIQQVEKCSAFIWHHDHANYRDALFAKQLLYSLEISGKKVFPNFYSGWHFDDKIGQKYLLESIGASLVPTYVFYDKKVALDWIKKADYPVVFKLRGGAGAANVRLVRNRRSARRLVLRAFSLGFSQFNKWNYVKERIQRCVDRRESYLAIIKAFYRLLFSTEFAKMHAREKGYVYFQKFVPDNKSDIRVIVINGNAFAIKRMVRKSDFRASGSGKILYDKKEIDERCIKMSFDVADKMRGNCIAFDYVFDENGQPMIIEISYGFKYSVYVNCKGYWSKDMVWHEVSGCFDCSEWIIQTLMQ